MASKNKMNKARNSYCTCALKWGNGRCKHLKFFDSTQRRKIKDFIDPKPYMPTFFVNYGFRCKFSDNWEEGYTELINNNTFGIFTCYEEDIEKSVREHVMDLVAKTH